jgi:hypothetical protein
MNIKSKILKGTKYLAILLVSFIALVLVINLSIFDEELKPEVEAMFEKQQVTIEADNAYIAIWGITAANDKSFIDAGIELMQRYTEITSVDAESVITDLDNQQILGERNLDSAWLDKYENCRSRTKDGCLKKVSDLIKINPITDPRLLLMLDRYSEMVKLKKYQHILEVSVASHIPSYSGIMRLSQIRTANVFLKNNTMDTLSVIEEELIFWRMMLSQSGDMLDKMIAVASLWRNFSSLSELIKSEKISDLEMKKLQSMLINFSKEEHDMSAVFYSEIKMSLLALIDMMSTETKTIGYISGIRYKNLSSFWQKNATLNDAYVRNFVPLVCLSKLTAIDFYKFQEQNKNYCKFPKEESTKYTKFSLYNPVGKILVSIGLPAYPDYIARVHDLNGVISLVKLQIELKSIDVNTIEEAVDQSAIRNLYTNEAMDYDKENNVISFKCLDKSSSCKISL